MPRQQGLLLRGIRWYSNLKVPKDLWEALGKTQFRDSLGTSDYREACRKIAYEKARLTALFDLTRKKMTSLSAVPAPTQKRQLTVLSKLEAHELACRYFVSQEGEFQRWMDNEGRQLDPQKLEDVRETIGWDAYSLATGQECCGQRVDGTNELQQFLKEEGIECAASSPAFQMLRPLIRDAELEHLGRSHDMVQGDAINERDPRFKGLHSHSQAAVEPVKGPTLDDLLALKQKALLVLGRSTKSVDAQILISRLLRETFGGERPLSTITREDMHKVFDLLQSVPPNAQQRYKGLTLAQAVAAAKDAGDKRRLSSKTLQNNFTQFRALFNLGVGERLLTENPTDSPLFRQLFTKTEQIGPREQFTIDELNRLFRAPLYTGCVDDERNYRKPGELRPKRGRFWVPLLALFHGTRCNEACQIHTADVKNREGITFISIREEQEDGGKTDKKLKTKQSRREVPLHPELMRLGFADFVEQRRQDTASPHLFPELTPGHKGYFSDAFSKWFSRFVTITLGDACKARMHSFRHKFRDATRAARLPSETVALLAGWEEGEGPANRQMNQYGRGSGFLRTLAEDLAKVEYPGLDLSHLHAMPNAKAKP
jgi:integrase